MFIPGDKLIGEVVDRPNRFVLRVKINRRIEPAHLRDPGRLTELIKPKAKVLIKRREKVLKTKYEVLAIKSGDIWVFTNSGYHSKIAENFIREGKIKIYDNCKIVEREIKLGKSRIDFLLNCNGERVYLEVKGCTLVINGLALFPDAPTERGTRHLEELIKIVKNGGKAAVLFLIMRPDAEIFAPNSVTDRNFSNALKKAADIGVKILAYSFKFENDRILPVQSVRVVVDSVDDIIIEKIGNNFLSSF